MYVCMYVCIYVYSLLKGLFPAAFPNSTTVSHWPSSCAQRIQWFSHSLYSDRTVSGAEPWVWSSRPWDIAYSTQHSTYTVLGHSGTCHWIILAHVTASLCTCHCVTLAHVTASLGTCHCVTLAHVNVTVSLWHMPLRHSDTCHCITLTHATASL